MIASVFRCDPTPTGVRSPLRNRSRTVGSCSRASRTDSVSINMEKVYLIVYTFRSGLPVCPRDQRHRPGDRVRLEEHLLAPALVRPGGHVQEALACFTTPG